MKFNFEGSNSGVDVLEEKDLSLDKELKLEEETLNKKVDIVLSDFENLEPSKLAKVLNYLNERKYFFASCGVAAGLIALVVHDVTRGDYNSESAAALITALKGVGAAASVALGSTIDKINTPESGLNS